MPRLNSNNNKKDRNSKNDKKKGGKGGNRSQKLVTIEFNNDERVKYITGFAKRKRIRRKEAEIKIAEKEKKMRKDMKREKKIQLEQEIEEKKRIKEEILIQNAKFSTEPLLLNHFKDTEESSSQHVLEDNAKGVYQFDEAVVSVSVTPFEF